MSRQEVKVGGVMLPGKEIVQEQREPAWSISGGQMAEKGGWGCCLHPKGC